MTVARSYQPVVSRKPALCDYLLYRQIIFGQKKSPHFNELLGAQSHEDKHFKIIMTPLKCFEPKNETQKNILKCAHCRIYFKIYPEKGPSSHLFMCLIKILRNL